MNVRVVGCSYRTAPVEWRERLAFDPQTLEKSLASLASRYGEAAILSTCNRVELVVARPVGEEPWALSHAADFLAEVHGVAANDVRPLLVEHQNAHAVRHLFRVASSLDSLVVGEGQIAGQVKTAFEIAQRLGTTGPFLNALFPATLRVAKRVRTETGITKGHVSVSSVAVDYVKQVFDHFADKTVLVIGAGKMARLTLKSLTELKPGKILVTNRSPEKAAEVARAWGGNAVAWDELDAALARSDIVLSTTGAATPIMPKARYRDKVAPLRGGATQVVLDIAVPRDFDPKIHDGERVFLFNIDDLARVREETLGTRRLYIAPAEQLVEAAVHSFADDWNRRRNGPVIGQLNAEVDKLRLEVYEALLPRLGDRLTEADRKQIDRAFKLFQNKLLHGPIAALDSTNRGGSGLPEIFKKLFRLE